MQYENFLNLSHSLLFDIQEIYLVVWAKSGKFDLGYETDCFDHNVVDHYYLINQSTIFMLKFKIRKKMMERIKRKWNSFT